MTKIYFDNNATTPIDPAVKGAMLPYLSNLFGNPSSGHNFGESAKFALNQSREQIGAFINGSPSRLIFTGGGTEANNTAIWSAISTFPFKKHIISSQVEHDSVLSPLQFLQDRFGYEITLLPVDSNGGLDLSQLEAAIQPDTALVSLMGANNETGVLWPIEKIGDICRSKSVLFHCDAVQMAGKIQIDMKQSPVDYLTMAAHKLHGPKGVGALYAQRNAPIAPLIMGAAQEGGFRAGTENVAGIVGFAKACELCSQSLPEYHELPGLLRNRLEMEIKDKIDAVIINGSNLPRLANTTNISFKNCSSASMVQELDEKSIAVSGNTPSWNLTHKFESFEHRGRSG